MNASRQQLSPAIAASHSCVPSPIASHMLKQPPQHLDLSGAAHLSISLSAPFLKGGLWQYTNGAIPPIGRTGPVPRPPIPLPSFDFMEQDHVTSYFRLLLQLLLGLKVTSHSALHDLLCTLKLRVTSKLFPTANHQFLPCIQTSNSSPSQLLHCNSWA